SGATPVGELWQHREKLDPVYGIGKGKCDELMALRKEKKVDAVLFLNDLTPGQQRNLERALQCRVIDRTLLILDIFAQHARTSEGKLQVELAQLRYLLPRLTGMRSELSRLGGGIGTRGPGEQKLEVDRRRVLQRIDKVKNELERVRRHRKVLRD